MTNHGCRFAWCTNDMTSCEAQRLEHFSGHYYYLASGSLATLPDGVTKVGLDLRFNEDIDPAPIISIDVEGPSAAEFSLRLDEAILLHDGLVGLIQMAITGTGLDPERVLQAVARSSTGGGDG